MSLPTPVSSSCLAAAPGSMRVFRTRPRPRFLAKIQAEHEDKYDDEDGFQRTIIHLSPVLESIAYPNSSEESMTSSELSRRAFLHKSATLLGSAIVGIPQVLRASPKAATELGKVKITDLKTAQVMARYVFNLVKIETDSGLFGIGEAFAGRASLNIFTP
jgi:hypothetical protein